MNKCSPVEMRKNLKAVDLMANHGIDFVVMPVTSPENKLELIKQAQQALETLFEGAGVAP